MTDFLMRIDRQPERVNVSRLVEAFLSGKKPHTIDAYNRDLKRFARWAGAVDAAGEPDVNAVAARLLHQDGAGAANALVLEFRAHELARGMSSSTISRRLSSLRALVELARSLGVVSWTLSIDNPDPEAARDMSGPTREQVMAITKLLDERCQPEAAKAKRDRAITRLLYDTGLRCGEVTGLDVEHVTLYVPEPQVMILAKGRRVREVIKLPRVTAEALRHWLLVYPHPTGRGSAPLFTGFDRDPSSRGKRLCESSVRDMVARLGADAGVTNLTVRPHGFRHSAATWLLDTTGDLRLVQSFLRHRSIVTTQRYDDSRKKLAIKAAHMVAGDGPT